MAVYASSVTLSQPYRERIGRRMGMVMGTVNITNYNQTLAEITNITKHFIDGVIDVVVIAGNVTDSGYQLAWNTTSKAFKAYFSDLSASTDGPLVEVGSDVDVGETQFVAFGITQ